MKKIKILHFTKVINHNDFIDAIIRHADPSRFEMVACSYQGESNIEDTNYDKLGVPNFKLNIQHSWLDMFRGAWRLSKILRVEKINIVHSHHFYESIIAQMACLLVGNCRHIIGRHYHNQFYLTASGLKLRFYLSVESIVNRLARRIVVPSTAIVELLIAQGTRAKKIVMIPYAFDFNATRHNPMTDEEIEKKREALGWENKFVIGNIGRHHIIKGQTYLIKAFNKVLEKAPNSKQVFIGDGPIHNHLVDEVSRLGLTDRVEFLGWRKDSHALINCLDVVVHPTLQEAFPQIMIETMALKKPLIITPVSGATDVIRDHENGILIPTQDEEAIVHAILELYLNPDLRKSLGNRASAFVRTHYSKDKIIPTFEELYVQVNSQS